MTRTPAQNSRFHTLLSLRKFDREDKAALVHQCTKGRTESSKEMTIAEMKTAIEILDDEQQQSIKKMRAKIINIGRDIFGMAPADAWGQPQYDRLNTFLLGKYKRMLHKLSYADLVKATTAMEAWRDSETKRMVNALTGQPTRKVGRPRKQAQV